MNPFGVPGLFQTQVDQNQLGFNNQPNYATLGPGWGFDPNLQTPSYDASYRPAYQGPNPYSSYDRPSFFQALGQTTFGKNQYWGNPIDNNTQAYSTLGSTPVDGAMWIGQRIVTPVVSFGIASALATNMGRNLGRRLASGLGATGTGSVGLHWKALKDTAGLAGEAALGGNFSNAWNILKDIPSGQLSRLGGAGVRAGLGAAGALAWPAYLAYQGAEFLDDSTFQPYIRSRAGAEDARRNFSGVTFAGTGGNVITGRGLSSLESSRIGNTLDGMGMLDPTFSANETSSINSMGMRAGLYDNVGVSKIAERARSVLAQVKMITAISKNPDLQAAIEEIAKLQLGGASIAGGVGSAAATAYSRLGGLASVAGVSVQRLMSTVGAQGQYMYQMNGMTPYLGQMAAADAFAGFSAANRAGVLSSGQLARMGGLEGATQSSLSAQIAGSRTPYSDIRNFNAFYGSGVKGSVSGNVAAFGAAAAFDPIGTRGKLILYGPAMAAKSMAREGSAGLEKEAIEQLRQNNVAPRGAGGKYTGEQIATVLEGMNISQDDIRAYAAQRYSETDPTARAVRTKSLNAQEREMSAQVSDQQQLHGGLLGLWDIAKTLGRNLTHEVAKDTAYPLSELAGGISDSLESLGYYLGYESTTGRNKREFAEKYSDSIDLDKVDSLRLTTGKGTKLSVVTRNFLNELNDDASIDSEQGSRARSIISGKLNNAEGKSALLAYAKNSTTPAGEDALNSMRDSDELFNQARGALNTTYKDADGYTQSVVRTSRNVNINEAKDFTDKLNSLVPTETGTSYDKLLVAGQAQAIMKEAAKDGRALGTEIDDMLKDPKYSALAKALKGMTAAEKVQALHKLDSGLLESGMYKPAKIAAETGSLEDIKRNPSAFITDPERLKQVKAAIAKGDDKEVSRLAIQEVGGRTPLKGPSDSMGWKSWEFTSWITGGYTPEDYAAKTAPLDMTLADSVSNNGESGVDWSGMKDAMAKFDDVADNLNGAGINLKEAAILLKDSVGGQPKIDPGRIKPGLPAREDAHQ